MLTTGDQVAANRIPRVNSMKFVLEIVKFMGIQDTITESMPEMIWKFDRR